MKPIRERQSQLSWVFFLFNVIFFLFMLAIHFVQIIIAPCALHESTRPYYEWSIKYSKRCFGLLLIASTQLFAPTTFVFTVDPRTPVTHIEPYFDGSMLQFNLPTRTVVISNHQLYLDWVYTWSFLYLCKLHDSLIIILKESLKWAPIVGPGMQYMRFIFLKRKWAQDQQTLTSALENIAQRAKNINDPFSLVIFPEGTLVGRDTRNENDTFAKKNGIPTQRHMLLPRSTGLLAALRILAANNGSVSNGSNNHTFNNTYNHHHQDGNVPSFASAKQQSKDSPLIIVDITVGYEGMQKGDYGQDFFTIQSVFAKGTPPPAVHFHLRTYIVDQIPLGEELGQRIATEKEKQAFNDWLMARWNEKDEMVNHFLETGSLVPLIAGDKSPQSIINNVSSSSFPSPPCKPFIQPIVIKNAIDWFILFVCFVGPLCIINWAVKLYASFK